MFKNLKNKFKKESDNETKNISNQNLKNHKVDIAEFLLILEQIQLLNNVTTKEKGTVLKNYKQKKESINDVIELAMDKYSKKIVDLDANKQN